MNELLMVAGAVAALCVALLWVSSHVRFVDGNRSMLNVIVADAGSRIEELNIELEDVTHGIQKIIASADDDDRDLDDDEINRIGALRTKADRITAQIEARQVVAAGSDRGAGRRRRTSALPPVDDHEGDAPSASRRERQSVPAQPRDPVEAARHGFNSMGQFAAMVHGAALGQTDARERFSAVATTYGNEGTGSEGGFLIPPEFRTSIWEKVQSEGALADRCTEFTTGSNQLTFPKDESAPWDSSSGVQVYWENEGAQIGKSAPADLGTETLRLTKLTALVNVTDELLEDAPGLESYLNVKTPSRIQAKINTALVRGNGVGKPLGILNSKSLVTVAPEVGQTADTVVFQNISKMWARMYAPSRRNAVWLINQDIESQLDQLAFPTGAATAVPLYMPVGGMSASPYATLKGRPVVPIEPCSTLGDRGDIILVDMTQYAIMRKAAEIQSDVSIHLYFDQSITAFRFVFRMTGQPLWSAPVQPENGTMTRSWAVDLADRA